MSCLFVNRICSLVYRIFVKFVLKDIICGKIRITTSKGIDFVQNHIGYLGKPLHFKINW